MSRLAPLLVALTGCALSAHPTTPAEVPDPTQVERLSDLMGAGPIEHTAIVSARWQVPLSGLLDLDDPKAKAAGKVDAPTPIVLPVHVLTHPVHGAAIVDTGVAAAMRDGAGPVGWPVSTFLADLQVVTPLADIVAAHPVRRALITHAHLDHVLGLPDLPDEVPVFLGPGELDARKAEHAALRGTYNALFGDRPALRTWPFEERGVALGPVTHALDLYGDGSLWALHVPGHTAGSTAFLARTTEGPMLFTGDCSHTHWGWDHGVTPGTFTADHEENGRSLAALKLLAEELGAEVFVGHEL
jgi:N-acyl homoserine lactone hydrolase